MGKKNSIMLRQNSQKVEFFRPPLMRQIFANTVQVNCTPDLIPCSMLVPNCQSAKISKHRLKLFTNIKLTNQQMPRMKSAKRRPMIEMIMKDDLSGKG